MPTAMPLEPLTSSCGSRPGQHGRLDALVVEVGDERNGLFIDVGEHVERRARQARFGIAVGRRRIGIDRAEVSVAVDQRIAQREILRHAHERVVDRRVAVRMVALEHLADDTGALAMLLAGLEAHLAHRVEDAALHGLEAVAHVGQRARGDNRHRIREIALPHLVFDVDLRYDIVVQYLPALMTYRYVRSAQAHAVALDSSRRGGTRRVCGSASRGAFGPATSSRFRARWAPAKRPSCGRSCERSTGSRSGHSARPSPFGTATTAIRRRPHRPLPHRRSARNRRAGARRSLRRPLDRAGGVVAQRARPDSAAPV